MKLVNYMRTLASGLDGGRCELGDQGAGLVLTLLGAGGSVVASLSKDSPEWQEDRYDTL
eukprot:SAG31_NODE_2376_length_5841_cov_10.199060_2_plen_59_part_00